MRTGSTSHSINHTYTRNPINLTTHAPKVHQGARDGPPVDVEVELGHAPRAGAEHHDARLPGGLDAHGTAGLEGGCVWVYVWMDVWHGSVVDRSGTSSDSIRFDSIRLGGGRPGPMERSAVTR